MEDYERYEEAAMILRQMPKGLPYNNLVAQLVKEVDPSPGLGAALHSATLGLVPGIAFEAVTFRQEAQETPEVYLRRRQPGEPSFVGHWHVPGSFFRDKEWGHDVADRLKREFDAMIKRFYGCGNPHVWVEPERGTIHSHIHLVELETDPREDGSHGWFPVNVLPHPMIPEHERVIIPRALEAFQLREM
ncbi:MAG TPA: hypothetical protein VJA27_01830 [Patescibacteria group bacterium]|nr:hypothetical protein [Patescibacteria group bacterium]